MLIKWYNGFKIKNNIHAEISRRTSYESFPKRNNCLINSVLYVCFYFMPHMDNHRVSAAHNPFHKDWNFILRQQWSDLIHNQVFFFKIIFFKIGTLYKYVNTCLYFIISYSMTFHILLFFLGISYDLYNYMHLGIIWWSKVLTSLFYSIVFK